MKTLILTAIVGIVVATTGAISASAHSLPGQPAWAVKAFGPNN